MFVAILMLSQGRQTIFCTSSGSLYWILASCTQLGIHCSPVDPVHLERELMCKREKREREKQRCYSTAH